MINACQSYDSLPDREEQEDKLFDFIHFLAIGDLPERGDDE